MTLFLPLLSFEYRARYFEAFINTIIDITIDLDVFFVVKSTISVFYVLLVKP